jgi:hypothetical protein
MADAMLFTRDTWRQAGAGFAIQDCAIRSRTRQCFLMQERQPSPQRPLPRTRLLFTYPDEPEPAQRYFFRSFSHFDFARLAFDDASGSGYVAVDLGGQVFGHGADHDGNEDPHPAQVPGSELAGVVTQLARIGRRLYSVGGPRRMHRRLGAGRWEDLTAKLAPPRDADHPGRGLRYLWQDVAGFSEEDLYAVGGEGDVWHFDGQKWVPCSFPSNELLFNVCCGGDGTVYIGGHRGSLYAGRASKWKKLADGDHGAPWKDLAWFGGRLWCGGDAGLWELRGSRLARAEAPPEVQAAAGALDVAPDGQWLLTAGPDGAALFDGTRWDLLFHRQALEGQPA